jgi:hypothetical protein
MLSGVNCQSDALDREFPSVYRLRSALESRLSHARSQSIARSCLGGKNRHLPDLALERCE